MKIMSRKQQYKIANILRKYVLKDHKDHISYGLCLFYDDRKEFEFAEMLESFDFFMMFPIPSGYIGGWDNRGATPLRLEFATRLAELLNHRGIYIESGKNGNFLRASQDVPGAKNARDKFFRWVRRLPG
jgi:hypothetical protein